MRMHIDKVLVKMVALVGLFIVFTASVSAKELSLDPRHQLLIGATEAAQGVVVVMTEDDLFAASPAMGNLQVQGMFDDSRAHVMVVGQLRQVDSFFDVFVDVDLQRNEAGAMSLAVQGRLGDRPLTLDREQSNVRFLESPTLDPKVEKEAVEQVMDLDMVGTIGLQPWDCEIVKYFRFFRGGQVITDRGVKIITRDRYIRAKYIEFSLWIRKGPIRRDIIVERRIFPQVSAPAPGEVKLDMQTSVGQATDTLNGMMTVTPAS